MLRRDLMMVWLVGASLALAACELGAEGLERVERFDDQTARTLETHQRALSWDETDNPSIFDPSFEYRLDALPTTGEAEITPWAGSYWPTYLDSINFRWDGAIGVTPGSAPSPSEKFATAFNRPHLVDTISATHGIESRLQVCSSDSDCMADSTEVCAKRPGAGEGRCVETWFGLCHAWAPAAIMVPEPKNPVTYNGVTFKVNDIKALVTLTYDDAITTKFLSTRCNELGDSLNFDENGRPTNPECRDTNPGTFHVVAANMLGLQKKSFIEDRTFDYEVWNQPVRGFTVLQNHPVSAAQANALVGATGSDYLFNDAAVSFHHVQTRLDYIIESNSNTDGNLSATIDLYTRSDTYEYLLELDAAGKIIGGEWLGNSKTNHPDFLWIPTVKGWTESVKHENTSGSGVAWHEVMFLVDESVKGSNAGSGGFDWGDICDAGDGTFEQAIAEKAIVEVGEIPAGKANILIDLQSDEDVDIQLYDKESGHPVVAWPSGDLNGHGVQTTTYQGMAIEYSGYNGTNGQLGHEYIRVNSSVTRPLVMKAYGYKAGTASVTYSYTAAPGCVDTGTGEFAQSVPRNDVATLGIIKTGKVNVRIQLQAAHDLDIQLYDGPVALIKWPDGKLNGYGTQTLVHDGVTLEWSGYNGVNGQLGNEYITITGTLNSELTMRVFGYSAGDAQVNYAWGLSEHELGQSLF